MNEVRVSSWNELNDYLFAESWRESIGRFRSYYVFRGLSDARYDLRTSLLRMGGWYDGLEANLLRAFQKYAQVENMAGANQWNWLALAAHRGLPTRLLDWTYSPYVALHFATVNLEQHHVDGAVWCVDYVKAREHLPPMLRSILEKEGTYAFTAEMLYRVASSLPEFDRISPTQFVCFFEPPSLDERIVNQFALFSLLNSPTAVLDRWLATRPELYRKVIIPAELKQEIRDKLDNANITERVLFPGLDGLSAWLKRYYRPGPTRPER